MQKFFSIAFAALAAALFAACGACASASVRSAYPNQPALVEHLRRASVAIVERDESGRLEPSCGGTFVDDERIVTAAHCVDGSSVGTYVRFADHADVDMQANRIVRSHIAVLVARSTEWDLALLRASPTVHAHDSVEASWFLDDGETVTIVGHPEGFLFSTVQGYVMSERRMRSPLGRSVLVTHVSAPIYYGSSGGGMFDADGKLVGVCSFMSPVPPLSAFFVAPRLVAAFSELP